MRTLTTHIFVDGGEHLDEDAVFGVRDCLVTTFTDERPGPAPEGRTIDGPWSRATFDIVLAPDTAAAR